MHCIPVIRTRLQIATVQRIFPLQFLLHQKHLAKALWIENLCNATNVRTNLTTRGLPIDKAPYAAGPTYRETSVFRAVLNAGSSSGITPNKAKLL